MGGGGVVLAVFLDLVQAPVISQEVASYLGRDLPLDVRWSRSHKEHLSSNGQKRSGCFMELSQVFRHVPVMFDFSVL